MEISVPEKFNFPCSYIIIDIETTGLSVNYHEIVEISAIKINNNEIVDSFNTLIKPNKGIESKASEINGITIDMVANAPKINEVLPDFLEFCKDHVIVAHNALFDLGFIHCSAITLCDLNFSPYYVDTLNYARNNINTEKHRLIDIAKYFNICIEQKHRALSDCYLLFECFKKMDVEKMVICRFKESGQIEKQKTNKFSSKILSHKPNSQNEIINEYFSKQKESELKLCIYEEKPINQDDIEWFYDEISEDWCFFKIKKERYEGKIWESICINRKKIKTFSNKKCHIVKMSFFNFMTIKAMEYFKTDSLTPHDVNSYIEGYKELKKRQTRYYY